MKHLWTRYLMRAIFPSRCLACGKRDETFCESCISLSKKTLFTPLPFITSLFDFKDPAVRRAIHAIKYYHRRDLVEPLANALARELKTDSQLLMHDDWILVPIPMPTLRKLLRGYNQAELIAQCLQRQLSLAYDNSLLQRSAFVARQVKTKTRAARFSNQKGTFAVNRNVHGAHILLVDDVTTTGSTLREARKTLLAAEAEKVIAVTLAH